MIFRLKPLIIVTLASALNARSWKGFLDQFADVDKFLASAAPGFCDKKDDSGRRCKTQSSRLIPPKQGAKLSLSWPIQFPFDAGAMEREDESDDALFYASPRLVQHFGDAPRERLAAFYSDVVASLDGVKTHVDLCSSWVSHAPEDYAPETFVGIGMNRQELQRNSKLTRFIVQDLNKNPILDFEDGTVDLFTNAMSVDYLAQPLQVFSEMQRALRPGGMAVMSFSNRFFPTKVIRAWREAGDLGHCAIAMSYLRYTGFVNVAVYDVKTGTGRRDPLYIVMGQKRQAGRGEEL